MKNTKIVAPEASGIDWSKVEDFEDFMKFSKEEPTILFQIVSFEGIEVIENDKTDKAITTYQFLVKDLKDEKKVKKLDISQKSILRVLKLHEPIIHKVFTITKIFRQNGYNEYTVNCNSN